MPDYDNKEQDEPASDPDDEILNQAQEDFAEAQDGDSQRDQRKEDLRFALGDSDNDWQWSEELLRLRKSPGTTPRPCLTINKVAEHIRQVTNDQRQNKPSIKVRPIDDTGDKDVAEVYAGIIRHIEYASDAQTAYNTACDHQVASGLGYFRILTEYCTDDSFDQDLRIARILNPYSVWDDPFIQTPEGSDRRYAFIVDDQPRGKFEQDNPGVSPAGWEGDESTGWVTKDSVRVAEYFYYEYKTRVLVELATGATLFDDDPTFTPEMRKLIARKRDVEIKTTKWCKLTGFKVLEKRDFPSRYIPLVRVVGDEYEIDGEKVIKGLTRNAKDPQRLFNYYRSSEAEVIGQQPKSPWLGYVGQFDGQEQAWKNANVSPQPFLQVNAMPDSATGQVLPLPQRQPPPQISPAFIQGAANASDDIKSATGQYDASLGARSNETSGIAIQRRAHEGDVSTYHYGDNLAKAVRFGGLICVDAIPTVYGAKQMARILGEDGSDNFVRLDPNQQQAVGQHEGEDGAIQKVYNLNVGRYDVAVTVGPSYTTKRQESTDFMTQLAQAYPPLMQQAGDIIIRNFDVPGADQLADRLKKFLPPQITQDEGTDQNDPKQVITQLQQQQQMLEQGIQQAEHLYQKVQGEMQKLAEENQLLKVKNAGKEGEIAVKHEQLAVQLIVEEMRANALAQNAAIENNFRHFNALLQSLTSHNQMAVDSQDSQAQLDAQERQAAQAAAQQQTTVQ